MAHELHDLAENSERKEVYDIIGGRHNSLYKTDPNFWKRINKFFTDGSDDQEAVESIREEHTEDND